MQRRQAVRQAAGALARQRRALARHADRPPGGDRGAARLRRRGGCCRGAAGGFLAAGRHAKPRWKTAISRRSIGRAGARGVSGRDPGAAERRKILSSQCAYRGETSRSSPTEPGTTRDVIEVPLDLHGYPVVLYRHGRAARSRAMAEREGVRRAGRRGRQADLAALAVRRRVALRAAADLPDSAALRVATKIDLIACRRNERRCRRSLLLQAGEGLDELDPRSWPSRGEESLGAASAGHAAAA